MTMKNAFSKENQLVRRICTYIFGLFLMAISSNLAVQADIGNSAVNSAAGILAMKLGITLGNGIILVCAICLLAQVILLRKDFKPYNVAQVPFAVIYGQFVNLVGLFLPALALPTYIHKVALMAVSIVLLATGICFFVGTELVCMPPEGLALALGEKTPIPFHRGKSIVDASLLVFAIVCSFAFFGQLEIVREGTVMLVLGTGWMVGIVRPRLPRWVQKWDLK